MLCWSTEKVEVLQKKSSFVPIFILSNFVLQKHWKIKDPKELNIRFYQEVAAR